MAQYVPYIPEVLPETPLFTPNLNFFDQMMQRKQSMFEQGLNKARVAYSSVLNAPLSDKENIPLRDQYVKDAKENLKSLSSADLSLPQNVSAAENIFAPFWEDQMIVQDSMLTKWYQGEAQKLNTWKNSADPKVRSQYNGIAEQYLMSGLEKLRNAGRNPDNYSKIERRQATPFENIQEYLQEQAKSQKMDIKNDDPSGPYLVETINGERSKKKYAAWASGVMGNNFYEQFKVTGIAEKEQRARNIKKLNPNLSDLEIDDLIGGDVISELDQGFQRRKKEVDVELANVNSLLGSLPAEGGEREANLYNQLIQERNQLVSKKAGIEEEYKYFDEPSKRQLKEGIKGNPDGYFAQLAKQRTIDNWATGRASVDSKLIKENTAWGTAETLRMRDKEFNLKEQEALWKRDDELWQRSNPTGGKGKTTPLKDANGNDITAPVEGLDKANSMMYRGLSGIDITKNASNALEVFNRIQNTDFKESFNLIFDQRGILSLAKKGLGLTEIDLSYIATAMQKEIESGYDHDFTKEQIGASNKLQKALEANDAVKNSGIKITGPSGLRQALLVYAQDYFTQRNANSKDGNDIPLQQDELDMMLRYTTATKKLERYTENEAKRDELIKKNILTNKDYASLLVDRNGKKDLMSISDLAKDMPTLEVSDKEVGGNIRNFNKEELAKYYMNGKLSHTTLGGITIDGNKYYIKKTDGKTSGLLDSGVILWDDIYRNKLVPKYGKSAEFSELMNKAQQSVVPDLLMYRSQTGKQGTAWTLITKPNKTMAEGDNAAAVIDQALNISNGDIYDAGGNRLDETTMSNIRSLLKSEKNMDDYISADYIPQGINGQRTLRLYFSKAFSEDSKQSIGETNLAKISGQTFDVVIKDGVTAPALDNLPNSTGYQVYDMISRGKEFKSDPVISASGFKFSITPNRLSSAGNADEQPEYVTVDLTYNLRTNEKDKSGKLNTKVEPKVVNTKFNLSGTGAKSPDEIVEYLYKLYYDNLLQNRNTQQEYEQYIKNTPEARVFNRDAAFKRDGVVLSK